MPFLTWNLIAERPSRWVSVGPATLFVVLAGLFATVAWPLRADGLAASEQTIRVAVKPIEPFVITGDGNLTGFSIDLWEDVARELGVETEYVVVSTVPEILEAVNATKVDAGIAAITITSDREKVAYKIRNMPKCPVRLVGPVFEHQDYAIAIPSGSDLREKSNRSLLAISESGRLGGLNKKWFGEKE